MTIKAITKSITITIIIIIKMVRLLALVPLTLAIPFPLLLQSSASSLEQSIEARKEQDASTLDDWLKQGSQTVLQRLLDNIGANGTEVQGALDGVVVASPSKAEPDYFYTWTRDAALVMKTLIDTFTSDTNANKDLQPLIHAYVAAQAKLQTVTNPSGDLLGGDGLGEPKYYTNLTAFEGSWGRPQRDGPPLRVVTFATYAQWLLDNGQADVVNDLLWPVMKNDLSYVGEYWNWTGVDLWEEVRGSSFFTIAANYRALVQGATIASRLNTTCAPCASQAPQVLCFLQFFWSPDSDSAFINSNFGGGRSGKDANSILGSMQLFDPSAGECDDVTFQPCSSRALANHKAVVDSFRGLYKVNNDSGDAGQGKPLLVGRYQEDVYYDGNPWYLTTYAVAEQLYDAVYQWQRIGSIKIDDLSLGFFKDVYPSAKKGTYKSGSSEFKAIIKAVKGYADGFFKATKQYTPSSYHLSEQISKENGTQLSARDLTWSYAAFLTAADRHNAVIPGSWRNASAPSLPGTCKADSVPGTYATPTETEWPTGTATPTATATQTPTCTAVPVRFNELVTTSPGQDIYVAGSIEQLGNWDTEKAVPLKSDRYSADMPLWYASVELPVGGSVEYKYVRKQNGKSTEWEGGENRRVEVPRECGVGVSTGDRWK
ncbi:hypothetical protein KEM55_008456 [Ascosphaera atra]|nr:hypothetical protein KEM55_008456 [Ascosphaera atra]